MFFVGCGRAQAGLEYLMTYGWALILIASIVGVFVLLVGPPAGNVSFNSSDLKVVFKSGSVGASSGGLVLQNAAGGAIKVSSVHFFGDIGQAADFKFNGAVPVFPVDVVAGGELRFDGVVSPNNCADGGTVVLLYSDPHGFERTAEIKCNGGAKMPVAWYRFDEGSGATALDSTGKNNCPITGPPDWTTSCPSGSCLQFDGTNDFINCGNKPEFKITGDLTIIYWARPSNVSSARRNPVCKSYGAEFCMTLETSNALSYYHGSTGTNASPYMSFWMGSMFTNDTWVHVAVTRSNSERRMRSYKNGRYITTTTWASDRDPSVSAAYNLQIGAGYVSRFLGTIDEVMVYNRKLSDFEVCSACREHGGSVGIPCC